MPMGASDFGNHVAMHVKGWMGEEGERALIKRERRKEFDALLVKNP